MRASVVGAVLAVLFAATFAAAQSATNWHLPYAGIAIAGKNDSDALVWLEADSNRSLNVNCVTGCAAGTPGQTTMANSSPVVIASNQSAVPVSFTQPSLVAGNANIGDVDIASMPAITCASGCSAPPSQLTHNAVMAATTNATVVKASAGFVDTVMVSNNGATIAYVKIYDKATAPTCGTDVPVLRLQAFAAAAGPMVLNIPGGRAFANGIGYCAVTGIADNSAVAVAASAYIVTIGYR